MNGDLKHQLRLALADSNARQRKLWAQQIVDQQLPLQRLMTLLHADHKTAQRFMWLIGNLADLEPKTVAACLPFLFDMRDQMSFPGMPRSVAKWLWRTGIPSSIEQPAIAQLHRWLGDSTSSIACKSYSAHALSQLVRENRTSSNRFRKTLKTQIAGPNKAFCSRMRKLLADLDESG